MILENLLVSMSPEGKIITPIMRDSELKVKKASYFYVTEKK